MLSTTFGMDMVGSADSPGSQKHHVSESPKARASSSLRSATTPHFLSKAPTSASTEWLFRSFTHPKNGSSNFTKATFAAIKIQKLYRGRIARAHFLHMYEHRHALYHMLIYLIFYVILIMCESVPPLLPARRLIHSFPAHQTYLPSFLLPLVPSKTCCSKRPASTAFTCSI